MNSEWRILYPIIFSFACILIILKAYTLKEDGKQNLTEEGFQVNGESELMTAFGEYLKEARKERMKDPLFANVGNPEYEDPFVVMRHLNTIVKDFSSVKEGFKEGESPENFVKRELKEAEDFAKAFQKMKEAGFKKDAVKEAFQTAQQRWEDDISYFRTYNSGQLSGTYNSTPYLTPDISGILPPRREIDYEDLSGNPPPPTLLPTISTPNDKFYDLYEKEQMETTEVDDSEKIRLEEETLPDYGSSISYFDGLIKDIPWDADNKDYNKKDILWGYVTDRASKAIFLKSYHRNLFGTPTNLIEDESNGEFIYYSPAFTVTADEGNKEKGDIIGYQFADLAIGMAGSSALDLVEEGVSKLTEKSISGTERLRDLVNVKKGTITADAFKAKYGVSPTKPANVNVGNVQKVPKVLGGNSAKMRVGGTYARKILKQIGDRISKAISKRMARFAARMAITKTAVLGFSNGAAALAGTMTAGAAVATGATLGAAAPLLLIMTAVTKFLSLLATILNVLFGVLDLVVEAIYQLINPLLNSIFQAQGVCPPGKNTFASLVSEDTMYFLDTFMPLGSIFTLLNDYFCFGDGNGELKKPLREQPYQKDNTLSIYYHQWPEAEIPRGAKVRRRLLPEADRSDENIGKYYWYACSDGQPYHKYSFFCRKEVRLPGNWGPFNWLKNAIETVASFVPTGTRIPRVAATETIHDPGYQPLPIEQLTFPWCNYASAQMMDRMAQFYYDNAWKNAFIVDYEKNIIEVSRIETIYAVVASSEFSCDIACNLVRYQFNPITGEHFKRIFKTKQSKNDSLLTHIRFYFSDKEVGPDGNVRTVGPNGLFTITGCTYADYTGVEAMTTSVMSEDEGLEYVPSVPKKFEIITKPNPDINWADSSTNWELVASNTVLGFGGFLIGAGGGLLASKKMKGKKGEDISSSLGTIGMVGSATASILSAEKLQEIDDVAKLDRKLKDEETKIVNGKVLMTETRDFAIDRGAKKELSPGFIPSIDFCKGNVITTTQCTNKTVLRDTIQSYHSQNPLKRVKEVLEIEPRGRNACYYKWRETSYNPETNIEGRTTTENEIIRTYTVANETTCQFIPDRFTTDFARYPIRTVCDLSGSYTVFNPDIRMTDPNIILYLNANPGARAKLPNLLEVKPTLLREHPELYLLDAQYRTPSTNLAPDYIRLSAEVTQKEAEVKRIADEPTYVAKYNNSSERYKQTQSEQDKAIRLNSANMQLVMMQANLGSIRMSGVPITLEDVYTSRPDLQDLYSKIKNPPSMVPISPIQIPQGHYTLPSLDGRVRVPVTMSGANIIYVTRKEVKDLRGNVTYVPSFPKTPFKVPRELPPSTFLATTGSCPPRKCEDLEQIEMLVSDFNAAHQDRQILKVVRGWTPKPDRCDYEVFMQRTVNGTPVRSKETLQINVAPSSTNQCLLTRVNDGSDSLNSGTFIIDATPNLKDRFYKVEGKDVSGIEISPATGVLDSMKSFVQDTLLPLFKTNIKDEVNVPAKAIQSSLETTQKVIAQNIPFQTCRQKKCSDPDVLFAINSAYNAKMGAEYISGGESNQMKKILKSAISGPDTCDVMFENLFELYDDILYPPVESYAEVKAYRFKMTTVGDDCSKLRVSNDKDSIMDLSSNMSLVIQYDTSTITPPYSLPINTYFDIRNPTHLRNIKSILETRMNTSGQLHNYKAVTQSFQRMPTQIEYKMIKDYSFTDSITGEFIQELNQPTYIRVDVSFANATDQNPSPTIVTVDEFFEYEMDFEFDAKLGGYKYFKMGREVIPPYLFDYDDKQKSSRVNTDVFLF